MPNLPKLGHTLSDVEIATVEPILLRAKIDTPVVSAVGTISERTVLLVRVVDRDGMIGWGEVFGNFPAHGAENRVHLINDYLGPLVQSQSLHSPVAVFDELTAKMHVIGLQCGEPGPLAQAIAGLDIALWDLVAKRATQPLWRLLGGSRGAVETYASGLNPTGFEGIVEQKLDEGYRAFKIKTGFGRQRDLAALAGIRKIIGDRRLMTDVNQGWDVDSACANWSAYSAFDLDWIEEPLAADRPVDEWQRIAAMGGACIAAGENLLGDAQFDAYIASRAVKVIQPDLCKWGGFSKVLPLAARIIGAGLTYCPHFLAGPIGIVASAHCLAAAGGDGMLEIDANPNPLREHLTGGLPAINDGVMRLPNGNGLGIVPDPAAIEKYRVN